ncbi:hypothetical protein E2C01_089082 [Portunus trituberculatus]|uniref:Uncharacterized protein n=1 Tax=Portunus trituberculatus TaxID=210409 RepID=A0A5B7JNL6_PORTR|nr:hypothetical protein [Portunus trituberculatus]
MKPQPPTARRVALWLGGLAERNVEVLERGELMSWVGGVDSGTGGGVTTHLHAHRPPLHVHKPSYLPSFTQHQTTEGKVFLT